MSRLCDFKKGKKHICLNEILVITNPPKLLRRLSQRLGESMFIHRILRESIRTANAVKVCLRTQVSAHRQSYMQQESKPKKK